jgi:hypothetical protein
MSETQETPVFRAGDKVKGKRGGHLKVLQKGIFAEFAVPTRSSKKSLGLDESDGPDQHACAVFLSNMIYGLLPLVGTNRG